MAVTSTLTLLCVVLLVSAATHAWNKALSTAAEDLEASARQHGGGCGTDPNDHAHANAHAHTHTASVPALRHAGEPPASDGKHYQQPATSTRPLWAQSLRSAREVDQFCPCTSTDYPCYKPDQGGCWTPGSCQFQGALNCSCPAGEVNQAGFCVSPGAMFEDVKPVTTVGNLVLLESEAIFKALKEGAEDPKNGDKGGAVKLATWAFLREFNDNFDFVMVVPYNIRGSSATHYSNTPDTTNGNLRANIYLDSYVGAWAVPTLHEIGHAWNVHLRSMFGNTGPAGHWMLTGLDKHGQLGGFTKDAIQCQSPAGRVPTSSAPCSTNQLADMSFEKGSLYTSHDGIGNYAKLEMVAMGLMSADELKGTADEEAPHCSDAEWDWGQQGDAKPIQNIRCSAINIITAQQVEDISKQSFRRLQRDQKIRIAVVMVMDGKTSGPVPTTLASLEQDAALKWWNDYTTRMPVFWNEATYKRSTLSIGTTNDDRGCGVKVGCPDLAADPCKDACLAVPLRGNRPLRSP